MRRKRDDKPTARQRWKKAAAARRQRTDPNVKREYLRERRFRFPSHRPANLDAIPVTSGSAALYYLDVHGRLHREDHRSAAQLIAAFQKGETPCPHENPASASTPKPPANC
jgi:hypothetical protein